MILRGNPMFDRLSSSAAVPVILAEATIFLAAGGEEHEFDVEEPSVGGRHFRVHLAALPRLSAHDQRVLISVVDRTAEVETERSLRAEMLHDSLTGLPNRLAFIEAIDAVIETNSGAQDIAVLAVDLTRFSRINECVGALAGDELIITVARRLMSALRDGDMLARMGGDEFGVLVRLIDGPGDALRVGQRLAGAMGGPIRLSELEIRIDCAIGCALWDDRTRTSGDLMRNAQVALKRAKRTGVAEVYRVGQVSEARRRFSLETDLRHAIEQDALSLAFQPLIDLETNMVAGFEALARWGPPESRRGLARRIHRRRGGFGFDRPARPFGRLKPRCVRS